MATLLQAFSRSAALVRPSFAGAALVLLLASAPASAMQSTLPNVAIVAADPLHNEVAWRLQQTSYFGQVAIFNAQTTTPTLSQLQAYDVVLTWSFNSYSNSTLLGDRLADFVDGGGGVVVAVFTNAHTQSGRYLGGRWITGGYEVVVGQGGVQTGHATLGTIHFPNHPLLAGVSAFDGGSSAWRPASTALTAGAQRIAEWSDGKTLVAKHGTISRRIDLGFYPLSDLAIPESWPHGPNGTALLANAVLYAATSTVTGVPFCSGDGSAAACPCGNNGLAGNGCANSASLQGANLVATGNASLSADTVTLLGSGMPNSAALYIQGTTQQSGGIGTPFGDGLRCVSGNILRLGQSLNAGGLSQYPEPGDASVSVRGMIGVTGTRTYQVWYRNAAPFCTPSTFNLSNGLEITWSS